jgi:porin
MKKYGIENNHGINIQGIWIGDTNPLLSGGIPNANRLTSNSILILDLSIDMEKFNGCKGGTFGAEFLQLNAQNTNIQAGSVQGYNSIPGVIVI